MKKRIIPMAIIAFALFPNLISAQPLEIQEVTDDSLLVGQTTKYYKTVTSKNTLALNLETKNGQKNPNNYTVEITEDEYNSVREEELTRGDGYIETTYKKMTSSIYQDGIYYQYKNELEWKIMPTVRSYDIIGIGMHNTVRIASFIYFNQYWCDTNNSCNSSQIHIPQIANKGGGASFLVTSGSLNTLKMTIYFDVEKNTPYTIYKLYAFGDYAHATTTVSESAATNYTLGAGGLTLDSSIYASYDFMSSADATANVNW